MDTVYNMIRAIILDLSTGNFDLLKSKFLLIFTHFDIETRKVHDFSSFVAIEHRNLTIKSFFYRIFTNIDL